MDFKEDKMLMDNMLSLKNLAVKEYYIAEILAINETAKDSNMVFTREQANNIIDARNKALQSYGRVELGIEVTKKIIEEFRESIFITEEAYVETLNELHEIFYYLKNETEEDIGDYKLIDLMKEYFENYCEGSLELLKSKLEIFAREFRVSGSMMIDLNREGV